MPLPKPTIDHLDFWKVLIESNPTYTDFVDTVARGYTDLLYKNRNQTSLFKRLMRGCCCAPQYWDYKDDLRENTKDLKYLYMNAYGLSKNTKMDNFIAFLSRVIPILNANPTLLARIHLSAFDIFLKLTSSEAKTLPSYLEKLSDDDRSILKNSIIILAPMLVLIPNIGKLLRMSNNSNPNPALI